MPDSDEVERKIREMLLEMGEDKLLAKFDESIIGLDERDRKISDTMEEMMEEIDRLLEKLDDLEDAALNDDENGSCVR